MNKIETFKNLDEQPIERDLLEIGQLTAELRHVNHETLHRLADVLNRLAKSMAALTKEAAGQIAALSATSAAFQRDLVFGNEQICRTMVGLKSDVQDPVREAQRTLENLQRFLEKGEFKRLGETILVTVITTVLSMFLYMRFLNW